mmetsp:Transcript_19125/g.44563  ORF Transcript_19125/g.44563 Transcript_19125/m.44563 type:complete len:90 (+) Transcript_19125:456-725(+)
MNQKRRSKTPSQYITVEEALKSSQQQQQAIFSTLPPSTAGDDERGEDFFCEGVRAFFLWADETSIVAQTDGLLHSKFQNMRIFSKKKKA